jgi:hypothetical protein
MFTKRRALKAMIDTTIDAVSTNPVILKISISRLVMRGEPHCRVQLLHFTVRTRDERLMRNSPHTETRKAAVGTIGPDPLFARRNLN